jgi:hypothetical protein
MIREANDLEIIDLAGDHIGGQSMAQRCLARRLDACIEGMHVANQGALGVSQIGDHAVVRIGTRERRVTVGGEIRRQQVIAEMQESEVAPEAGVEFLRMQDRDPRRAGRSGVGTEPAEIRHALLLVDDEILHDIEVLGARLAHERLRRVAVVPAVVQVHVQVDTEETPESGRQRLRPQCGTQRGRLARAELDVLSPDRMAEAMLHAHAGRARGQRQRTAGRSGSNGIPSPGARDRSHRPHAATHRLAPARAHRSRAR